MVILRLKGVRSSILGWGLCYLLCNSAGLVSAEGLEATLGRCCNLGAVLSWDNKTCSSEQVGPVTGVPPEYQATCTSMIGACCRKSYREKQCSQGHETAKSGKECGLGFGPEANFHKDCCEGCKLGLVAGAMGLYCEFQSLKLALGPPWDTSLTKCCLEAGGKPGYPSTESPYILLTTNPSGLPTLGYSRPTTTQPANNSSNQNSSPYSSRSTQRSTTSSSSSRTTSSYLTSSSLPSFQNSVLSAGCPVGFTLNVETQVCDDIDECQIGQHRCFPYKKCRNTPGSYVCDPAVRDEETKFHCPPGYQQNGQTGQCDDIDECAKGYDICARETQHCINIPGGFDCQNKKDFTRYDCPTGYKFNITTLNCEDVDECDEKLDSCNHSVESCRNTAGAYECDIKCRPGFRYDIRLRNCQDINECFEGTHDCRIEVESCVNVAGSYQCHQLDKNQDNDCPPGYEPNKNYTFLCQDRDECSVGLHTCAHSETCINEIGGYRCEGSNSTNSSPGGLPGSTSPYFGGTTLADSDEDSFENTIPDTGFSKRTGHFDSNDLDYSTPRSRESGATNELRLSRAPSTTPVPPSSTTDCPGGFRASYRLARPAGNDDQPACEDIDECRERNPCDSTQVCSNTIGSYYCRCKSGYYRDPITQSCQDINECQTGQHSCLSSQRCDNSPGSYTCIRITGCGTGYTLNSQTGQCDDDDECLFGTHDCHRLGGEYQCKNTLGSFTCEKVVRQCPAGLSLAPTGECRTTCASGYVFNPRGECIDIDECAQALITGSRLCSSNQRCINSQGGYQCISKTVCPSGFEPDDVGTRCVDIDECARGTHSCKANQQCLNRGGGYICQCPSGHTMTPQGYCDDIDECAKFGTNSCGSNADCYNTIGSFRCICKEGFELDSDNRTCSDINECQTIVGLCEQKCINMWGTYECGCDIGYILSEDKRTCQDINECDQNKDGVLCLGRCENTQGSYRCDCPQGFLMASDGKTCQDIDECQTGNVCRQDEFCLNTRGGFRCNRIQCPPGYAVDGTQMHRCKMINHANSGNGNRDPLTISKSFLSFQSNYSISTKEGFVDLFTMRGPNWPGSMKHFDLQLKSARASSGVPPATRSYFLLRRPSQSSAVVALAKPILGPQDVELELRMDVYHRGNYAGSAVAQILIVVTKSEI